MPEAYRYLVATTLKNFAFDEKTGTLNFHAVSSLFPQFYAMICAILPQFTGQEWTPSWASTPVTPTASVDTVDCEHSQKQEHDENDYNSVFSIFAVIAS